MKHQILPFEKMKKNKVGALFMEMGTGKTRVAIELIYHRLNKIDRVIWFCPVSIRSVIQKEIEKHSTLTNIIINSKTDVLSIINKKIIIVGIESMSSSNNVVLKINKLITTKTFVIVDESHYIKGNKSIRTRRITNISQKSKYRLLLSGTPISQGIVDLYSQMRFLSHKILKYNSFYSFSRNHLVYSKHYPGMIVNTLNKNYIANCIAPYIYQIQKSECFKLPKKIYKTYSFYMSDEQQQIYNKTKTELLMDIDIYNFKSYTLFILFTKLQQIVSGFYMDKHELLPLNNDRLSLLVDIISNINVNEKIIIWVKYKYNINTIEKELSKLNDGISLIHGGLTSYEKDDNINKFRNENRFLIATTSCGGIGITLNECNYAIFFNNEFKYSNRLQAEDRIHRIGQNKDVYYIDIVCKNSIDVRIMDAISSKGNAVNMFKKELEKIKHKNKKIKLLQKV